VLAYRFCDHPGLFDSPAVAPQRSVPAVKGQLEPGRSNQLVEPPRRLPGPHTRAESRFFAVGGKIPRDADSSLEQQRLVAAASRNGTELLLAAGRLLQRRQSEPGPQNRAQPGTPRPWELAQ
jgi:hypothetical protein